MSFFTDLNLNSIVLTAPWGPITFKHLLDIGTLIIIEGLLSFDNALALAATVKTHLTDPQEQRRALRFGIWGAYIFRTIVILLGVKLMKIEWVKAAAAGYLICLAVTEFWPKRESEELTQDTSADVRQQSSLARFLKLTPFWSTVIAVELMDIMFSIDSIGAALAISNQEWILIAGAFLGILMMRFAASIFIKLIDSFPVLNKTAFLLVGLAGFNMILKLKGLPLGPFGELTIDKEIPEHIFTLSLAGIFFGSMALNAVFPAWFKAQTAE